MTNEAVAQEKYGPAGFVAALVHIFILNFATLVIAAVAFPVLFYFAPILLGDLLVSVVLMTRPAKLGQIGRGMLIGWLSAPVSLILFASVFIVGKAIGL
ncbi:hypothetical protein ACWDTP_20905 [Mycobacterium sp. NPDC003449]